MKKCKLALVWQCTLYILISYCLGCTLAPVEKAGDHCPPGQQSVDGVPRVEFDVLTCYSGYFEMGWNPSSIREQCLECCKKSEDDDARWRCSLESNCTEACYQLGSYADYQHCLNYQKLSLFDAKHLPATYAWLCDFGYNCEKVSENKNGQCPADFAICKFDEENGQYYCAQTCSDPLIFCSDPTSEDREAKVCVDPYSNDRYCGASGNCTDSGDGNSAGTTCQYGKTCVDGVCVCPKGTTACGEKCVNTQNNRNHCGECNRACNGGEVCIDGNCSDNKCSLSEIPKCRFMNECVNYADHCGSDCINCKAIKNADEAECIEGRCSVTCIKGYHFDESEMMCVLNTVRQCGGQKGGPVQDCTQMTAAVDPYCGEKGECYARSCSGDYVLDMGTCKTPCDFCDSTRNEVCVDERACQCDVGFAHCPNHNTCADLLKDSNHCGACGNACGEGTECVHGICK